MVSLFVSGLMEPPIQVNGNNAKKMAKELYNFLMAQFIKDNSRMTNQMDKDPKYFPTAVFTQAHSSSECSTAMENSSKLMINLTMKVIGNKIK